MLTVFMSVLLALLTQRTQSFTLSLDAPVAEATPLFGPVREREWSPEWAPTFLHPPGGAQQEGAGHVAYVVVTPNFSTANTLDAVWAVRQRPHWEAAINAALAKARAR